MIFFFIKYKKIVDTRLNNGESAIPPLFSGPHVLSSAYNKVNLFVENFSKNSNLDESCISLLALSENADLI